MTTQLHTRTCAKCSGPNPQVLLPTLCPPRAHNNTWIFSPSEFTTAMSGICKLLHMLGFLNAVGMALSALSECRGGGSDV